MLSTRLQNIAAALVASLVLVAVVTALASSHFFQDVSTWGFDQLAVHASPHPANADIVIVDFDDRTQQQVGRYPIPRTVIADVLHKVSSAKPQLVGLDLLLSEPRPQEDAALAAEISAAGNVVLVSELGGAGSLEIVPLPEFCTPDLKDPSYCSQGAFGVGFSEFPVDDDGFVRRDFLLPPSGKQFLPFATMLATNFSGHGLVPAQGGAVRLGEHEIRLDGRGLNTFLIGNWNDRPLRTISAADVLAGKALGEEFRGKLVLIGQSSEAGKDHHLTSLFRSRDERGLRRVISGTAIHAAAVATLLKGCAIGLQSRSGSLIALVALGFIALLIVSSLRPWLAVVSIAAISMVTYEAAQWLFNVRAVWFDFTAAVTLLISTLLVGFGWRYIREHWLRDRVEAERAQLMTLFSHYVSAEAAEEIWRRRDEIRLGGEERFATVLFSDIRDFTRTTEGKPSNEVIAWLNEYFEAMSSVIQSQGGFLNKFIGDGIMAVYGVPLSSGEAEDARNALRTAVLMLSEVERLNERHAGILERPPIRIGIGIHSGTLTAGTVGASNRMEYSVIGETVNLASRLEGLTKEYGVPIVVSAVTSHLLSSEFSLQSLGQSKVKGISDPVEVYTVGTCRSTPVPHGGEV